MTKYDSPNKLCLSTFRKSKLALLEGKETIKSILTCQLTKLPLEFWKGLPFVSFQGRQLQVFNNKTNTKVQKMGRYHFLRKNTDFYRNLSNLQGECKKAKKVVIKTIRFPMLGLSDLVSRMGKVKIIHLLRDPRPTVLSQIIRTTQQDFRKYTKDFCNRVLSDLSTADLFNVLFPTTNVIRIRYEHFASHPVDMTQVLFKYLNLNLTNDIINTVKEMTSANKTEKEMEQIGMARKKPNSTQEINKWRRFVRFKNVKVIDRECSILYEKVGYLPIYSIKMLRDKSEFVFKDVQSNINNHEYSTDNNFPSGFITRELGYK